MDMNRRAFLKLAGLAAAACAVPPVFAAIAPKPVATLRDAISHVELVRADGVAGPIFEVPDSWFSSPNELINGSVSYGPASEVCTFDGLRFFGPGGDVFLTPFHSGAVTLWHGCTLTVMNCNVSASYA